ncbi:MAG TPA: NUDIX domain-containing protein [Bacilli bacterium]|nr:NUDIX domain-containing protein [Bacilli bacterium]
MNDLKFYNLGTVEDSLLSRVVIMCRYKNKWIFCKHKERNTWEIPGGHIEEGETWLEVAKRELYEEIGATKMNIRPVFLYSISKYAILCYAEIEELTDLPDFEIEKIEFFDKLPKDLTYPWHSNFYDKVQEFLKI